eukprot:TRINITY_DN1517_c0_g1_i1.p1 TRINITY_DN1517_c0_g1~~TRINITY_DN1517_c0_g1_i1.p1  ORF type:complete len:458 (+),score=128.96 TRINITY_DN1517_c0_g1_i1:24-1376(+)
MATDQQAEVVKEIPELRLSFRGKHHAVFLPADVSAVAAGTRTPPPATATASGGAAASVDIQKQSHADTPGDDVPLFSSEQELFDSPLSQFMKALQEHFGLRSDIALSFPLLKLRYCTGLSYAEQSSVSDLVQLWEAYVQNTQTTQTLVEMILEELPVCFVDQYTSLLRLAQPESAAEGTTESASAEAVEAPKDVEVADITEEAEEELAATTRNKRKLPPEDQIEYPMKRQRTSETTEKATGVEASAATAESLEAEEVADVPALVPAPDEEAAEEKEEEEEEEEDVSAHELAAEDVFPAQAAAGASSAQPALEGAPAAAEVPSAQIPAEDSPAQGPADAECAEESFVDVSSEAPEEVEAEAEVGVSAQGEAEPAAADDAMAEEAEGVTEAEPIVDEIDDYADAEAVADNEIEATEAHSGASTVGDAVQEHDGTTTTGLLVAVQPEVPNVTC